jgi:hypothetical protein
MEHDPVGNAVFANNVDGTFAPLLDIRTREINRGMVTKAPPNLNLEPRRDENLASRSALFIQRKGLSVPLEKSLAFRWSHRRVEQITR